MRASLACSLAAAAGCVVSLIANTGCGEVKSACSGEESDGVDCTLDICNPDTGVWAHVPDNSGCDTGMACTVNGCVPGAALSGNAFLLGHDKDDAMHDHSGIKVSLVSPVADGELSTTTAADGSWTLPVAAGTYTVTYHKDKFFDQTSPNVVVSELGGHTPDVTLTHYQVTNSTDKIVTSGGYNVTYSVDKTAAAISGLTDAGQTIFGLKLDGKSEAVPLVVAPNQYAVTSDRLVYVTSNNVWSVPLDGSQPPTLLGTGPINGTGFVGQPGTYTLIYKSTNTQTSFWVARTDGSIIPPTTPAFTTSDQNHPYAGGVADDQSGLVFTNNYNYDGPGQVHRIDFATNTAVNLNVGNAFSSLYNTSVSPDGKSVYFFGYFNNGSIYHYRGVVMPISGATLTSSAQAANPNGNGDNLDGQCYGYGWLGDSSAYATGDCSQAAWKVWAPGNPASVPSAPIGGAFRFQLGDSYGIFTDSSGATRVFDKTGASAVIDNSSTGFTSAFFGTGANKSYVVMVEPTAGGLPNRVVAATIASPLAATTVQLGGAIPSTCQFEGALSGSTFYSLCSDTGVLTAYAKGVSAAAGQTMMVRPGLVSLDAADRIGFNKTDGVFYSSANSAPLASPAPISKVTKGAATTVINIKDWLLFRDPSSLTVRSSKADGSVIDEPLYTCDPFSNGYPQTEPTDMYIYTPGLRCADNFIQTYTPLANMP